MSKKASLGIVGSPSAPPPPVLRTLTVNIVGSGAVTATPGGAVASGVGVDYTDGSIVNLNATAAAGWTLSGMTGGGITPAGDVTMDANKTVTVTFTLNATKTCLKGMQVSLGQPKPIKASAVDLAALGTGLVRGLVFGNPPYTTPLAYCQEIMDHPSNMKLIVMLDWDIGWSNAQWDAHVDDAVARLPCHYIEIGNEMGRSAWDTAQPDPTFGAGKYWTMVRRAVPKIQAANVLPGNAAAGKKQALLGAARDIQTNPLLDNAAAQGDIFGMVDGVCIHPYGSAGPGPANGPFPVSTVMNRVFDAHSRVPANMDLFLTEMGWATGGVTGGGLVQTRAQQAAWLSQIYNQLFAKRTAWNLASIGWYIYSDYGQSPTAGWAQYCGIVDATVTPRDDKPSRANFLSQPKSMTR